MTLTGSSPGTSHMETSGPWVSSNRCALHFLGRVFLASHSDPDPGLLLVAAMVAQGILINGQFPGPQIEAVTNDNVIINVFNSLPEPFLISWSHTVFPSPLLNLAFLALQHPSLISLASPFCSCHASFDASSMNSFRSPDFKQQ